MPRRNLLPLDISYGRLEGSRESRSDLHGGTNRDERQEVKQFRVIFPGQLPWGLQLYTNVDSEL
jgi:hypothetical protein